MVHFRISDFLELMESRNFESLQWPCVEVLVWLTHLAETEAQRDKAIFPRPQPILVKCQPTCAGRWREPAEATWTVWRDYIFTPWSCWIRPSPRAELRFPGCDPCTSLLSSAKWSNNCTLFSSVNDCNRPMEWTWRVVSACHLQLLNFVYLFWPTHRFCY